MESSLLDRLATFDAKADAERKEILDELREALDPSDLQNSKTEGQTVLDNEAVMDVLLKWSTTTSSADVAENALEVLLRLARDGDNAKRLFQEHPSLVSVGLRKLEFGAENATNGVQNNALGVLWSLAFNVDNEREMATNNPTLIPLLVAKVESNSEQVQEAALGVLQSLACNDDNATEMFAKNPTLVSLLVVRVESDSEQVQERALNVLWSLVANVDNKHEMATNNPTLIPLLVTKVESNSEQVQEAALGVLCNLANNYDNKREMITENPTLVPLLVVKVESNSEQVQIKALEVLCNLSFNVDNKREMVIKNPTLVPLLVVRVESNSEHVQIMALGVLQNLALNVDNKREMITENPTLVPLLVAKAESNSEQVQERALNVLWSLAANVDNAREMFTKNPTLAPLLMAKVESNSEQVQEAALGVLKNLAFNVDNATEMMATSSAVLLPLLVTKMNGNIPLEAIRLVYGLSCSPANRAILRGNDSVVAALTKGREKDVGTSFFSPLALINLFGAEEDSKVLKTDLAMLQRIFGLIARAMNKEGWDLNHPLLAFRYLCVVEHNRQLLWNYYQSKFLTSVLAALQQAIEDKNASAIENAVITLTQFVNDTEPAAWMRRNKLQLDQVIAQLAPFPDALKAAQFLQLTLDQLTLDQVEGGQVAEIVAPPVAAASKQPVPQNEAEIRQWLSNHKHGEEIANKLVGEGLVEAEDLENLFKKSAAELKTLINLNAKQALRLEAALKELS
ncbi:hypothetical protein BASA81_002403 [Batrachochytrium salamandrivorans]|nr:hypothetical protein BASA81_002403 [Batrachochytrium salamandrivorans]